MQVTITYTHERKPIIRQHHSYEPKPEKANYLVYEYRRYALYWRRL